MRKKATKLVKPSRKKATANKRRPIKCAHIADPMGHGFGKYTPEDEMLENKELYEEILERPLDVKLCFGPHDIEVGTEIVFYDYGGMMPGSESLMESNARYILKWAQDHPSALVIIISSFTYRHFVQYEAEQMGLVDEASKPGTFDDPKLAPLTIPNVIVDSGGHAEAIPEWWRAGLKD